MKVKVTATITYETELNVEDYCDVVDDVGNVLVKTGDEILAFERENVGDGEEGYSGLVEAAISEGDLSDIKIEKVEETAEAEEAA